MIYRFGRPEQASQEQSVASLFTLDEIILMATELAQQSPNKKLSYMQETQMQQMKEAAQQTQPSSSSWFGAKNDVLNGTSKKEGEEHYGQAPTQTDLQVQMDDLIVDPGDDMTDCAGPSSEGNRLCGGYPQHGKKVSASQAFSLFG